MGRTGVSAADVEALVAAADSLSGLGSLVELRERAVEIAAELIDSTMVAWNEVDLDGREIDAVMAPPPEEVTTRPVT